VLDHSPIQKLRQIKTGGMSYEMVYRLWSGCLLEFMLWSFRVLDCAIEITGLYGASCFREMMPPDAAIKDVTKERGRAPRCRCRS
jgi:hypothetical protein